MLIKYLIINWPTGQNLSTQTQCEHKMFVSFSCRILKIMGMYTKHI